MIVKVGKHKIKIEKELINEKEINITKCQFVFDDDITNGFVKEAYFTQNGVSYKQIIVNNECDIPYEVLAKKGEIEIGVVAFLVENGEEITRYNPMPDYITTLMGSLKDNAENTEPITPTDKEQIKSAIANIQAEQITQNEGISQNTSDIEALREGKQDKLISGQNIKTINNESLLGAGNLEVITDLSDYYTKGQTDDLLDDKADKSEIPDVSEFITKDVDNLTNYTKTNDMNAAINTVVGNERTSRESSDVALQSQIDAITASSDVVDVVSTYQDLLNYSTTSLTEDDIIKVMQDESHSNAISYFRWQLSTWVYIGSEGPFYTKGETDTLLNNKANISDLPDLTDYVKNTDYATTNKGGVIRISSTYSTNVSSSGNLVGMAKNYEDYINGNNNMFMSKGTLENVITGKQLVNQTTLDESQAAQDENIEELKAELDRYKLLENAMPHTENETPSDYVTLEDTAKSPMEVTLIPQTSQETTTGKQLFDNNRLIYDFSNVNASENNLSSLPTGIRYSTTRLSGSPIVIFKSIDLSSYTGKIVRMKASYGEIGRIRIGLTNSDVSIRTQKAQSNVSDETISFEIPTDLGDTPYLFYALVLRPTETDYVTDFTDVVLTIDNDNMNYEKYTGGIPAPNPDYPEDIHCTTGDNQVKVVGKNLFDSNTPDYTGQQAYVEYGGTAYVLLDNGIKFESRFRAVGYEYDNLKIGETYTLSFDAIANVSASIGIGLNVYQNSQAIEKPSVSRSITTTKSRFSFSFIAQETNRIAINSGTNSSLTSLIITDIQLEENSSTTSFSPYEETTYPISLGNKEMYNINGVYDGFVYDETEDKFYINRNIGKVILSENRNWTQAAFSTGQFYYRGSPISDIKNNNNEVISNYFVAKEGWSIKSPGIWADANNTIVTTQGSLGNTETVDDFKSWLSTHNTIVVYQLANATLEEITDTTLISQLRAIKNALSMQGATHIISTSTGENLPFLIKARAVQNISNS